MTSTINAAAGVSVLSKSWRESTNLFDELVASDYERPLVRQQPRKIVAVGVLEVDVVTQINAQFATLNKKIDTMNYCGKMSEHCGGNHASSIYLTSPFMQPGIDQANYVNYKKQQVIHFSTLIIQGGETTLISLGRMDRM